MDEFRIHVDVVSPLCIFTHGLFGSFPILFDGFVVPTRQELIEVFFRRQSVAQFRRAKSKQSFEMGQCCLVYRALERFDDLVDVSVRCDVGASKPSDYGGCF
jgi:hypothetical protein